MDPSNNITNLLTNLENQYLRYQHLIPDLTKLITLSVKQEQKINKTVLIDNSNTPIITAVPTNRISKPVVSISANSKYSDTINIKQFTGLCISVGGVRGLLQAGALHEFYIRNQLNNLKYYAGSSVGSLICMLLAVGYFPIDILTAFCSSDLSSQFSTINFVNLPTTLGLYPQSIIKNKLVEMVMMKLKYIPTFEELYNQTGNYLVIPIYCLSDRKNPKIYCSPINTPDMNILDAVILSCSIPVVFQKAKYKNKVYIDGAYADMFPINELNRVMDEHSELELDNRVILGIKLEATEDDLNTLPGYLLAIHMIPLYNQENSLDVPENSEIIELSNIQDVQSFKFNLSVKEKMDMFSHGIKQIKKLFDELDKTSDMKIDNEDENINTGSNSKKFKLD